MSFSVYQQVMAGTLDVYGYLEMVRYRFGLTSADIWNRMLVPDPRGDIWARIMAGIDEAYLANVRQALAERGMTIENIAVDGANLWDDDPEVRAANKQAALLHLELGSQLGARSVRLDTGGTKGQYEWTNEQFDWIAALYREYCVIAADAAMRVGPENHTGAATIPENIVRLCQAVDHPAFGVLLHLRRWKTDDPAAADAAVAPWAMHTHVTRALTLDGIYDAMSALRDLGYNGCWSIEMPTLRLTELEIWVAAVKDVFARWALGA
jgi:sugar phosphate isomerase/epimerase